MSDLSEAFKAMKQHKKAKKVSNLEYSTNLLNIKRVEFVSNNEGIHLVINHNGMIADFWPSTGKYQIRGKGYFRGVKNLLSALGVK